MTTGESLAVVALVVGVAVSVALMVTRRNVRHLQKRVHALETRLHDDLAPAVDAARRDAATAVSTARRATVAVGVENPPPRLAFEPVAAPLVRAVALGAGARRALVRLARPSRLRRKR